MNILFSNKIGHPGNKIKLIAANILFIILISTAISLTTNYFLIGDLIIDISTFLIIAVVAIIKLYLTKTLLLIEFDSVQNLLIVTQKNGFEKIYLKKLDINKTHLSPITKEFGELEFDFVETFRYTRISSKQKGISKSDVNDLHQIMQDEFGLVVQKLK